MGRRDRLDPALVNDLDLRVYYGSMDGTPDYYAWTLDRNNPSNYAVADDYNYIDPLEQVVVHNPTPGKYFILVWGWEVPNAPLKYSLVSEHFPTSNSEEEFPWTIFYPAFTKKKIP